MIPTWYSKMIRDRLADHEKLDQLMVELHTHMTIHDKLNALRDSKKKHTDDYKKLMASHDEQIAALQEKCSHPSWFYHAGTAECPSYRVCEVCGYTDGPGGDYRRS
jgi:rubrerythrin